VGKRGGGGKRLTRKGTNHAQKEALRGRGKLGPNTILLEFEKNPFKIQHGMNCCWGLIIRLKPGDNHFPQGALGEQFRWKKAVRDIGQTRSCRTKRTRDVPQRDIKEKGTNLEGEKSEGSLVERPKTSRRVRGYSLGKRRFTQSGTSQTARVNMEFAHFRIKK